MGISELKQWRSRLSEDEILQLRIQHRASLSLSCYLYTLSFVRAPTTLIEEELAG